MIIEDVKIYALGTVGFGSPAVSWFVDFAEPIFRVILMAGQAGVAIITIIYIARKLRSR